MEFILVGMTPWLASQIQLRMTAGREVPVLGETATGSSIAIALATGTFWHQSLVCKPGASVLSAGGWILLRNPMRTPPSETMVESFPLPPAGSTLEPETGARSGTAVVGAWRVSLWEVP